MTEAEITGLLLMRHEDDFCLPQCKTGVGGQKYTERDWAAFENGVRRPGESTKDAIIDVWVVRREPDMFINHIAYEIKCSRADLFGDRKYPSYCPYCNSFFFAVPNGLVTKEEMNSFAPQCGFIQVTSSGRRMQIVRWPVRMNRDGIEPSVYHHVLMWRVKPTKQARGIDHD